MQVNEKERLLLQDMISHEELCIQKYEDYAQQAHDAQLKSLFADLGSVERQHLDTLTQISSGAVPPMKQAAPKAMPSFAATYTANTPEKDCDKYLCSDALSTEKQVSSLYNTAIFEFTDTSARQALNHIQKEEQEHGEKLYLYMAANGMYCAS